MRLSIRPALLALAASGLGACASFRFESQTVDLRLDPESDALVFEVVYRGIHSPPKVKDAVPNGVETVARLGAGRRHFIVFDWFFEVDIDELEPPEEVTDLERRAFALLPGISVERAGLFVDEEDHLGAYQRFRLANLGRAVALANAAHSHLVQEVVAKGERDPDVDDRTWELWRERAEAGGPWFVIDGDALEYRAPLTPHSVARLFEATARECLKSPDDSSLLVQLLGALTELSIEGELAVFRFEPGVDGRIHLEIERPKWAYSPELLSELERTHGPVERLDGVAARARVRE